MFEKIVLRRSDKGSGLTAGELAEALLFYQNVHLILDYASLNGLIQQIGMPTLVALLTRQNVSAVYCEDTLGTHTDRSTGIEIHDFIAFRFAGDQNVGQLQSRQKILEYILVNKHQYEKKQAKRLVERFRLKVHFRDLTTDHFVEGGITKAARMDLNDEAFIHKAVAISLRNLVGERNVPDNFVFNAKSDPKGFRIETNLDFSKINEAIKKAKSFDGDLTPAHLVGNVLNARADTILASYYGGEFYTSSLTSEIIRTKYAELIRRAGIEKNELQEFQEIIIGSAPSLREVINSKERNFDEFLLLLDKSQKFREWAHGVNPDDKLVREYWNEVSSEGWVNKLPSKALRYIIGAAAGAIEPISGHAISIADSFLLEKLLGGWKPSHFIDKKLKPFLGEEN